MRRFAFEIYRVGGTLLGWAVFLLLILVWGVLVVPATLLLLPLWPGVQEHFASLTRRALRLYVGQLPFLRLCVEGVENRIDGPRILVANHQSRLDSPVLLALEPRLCGPVRGYMLRVPIVGAVIRLVGFFDADAGESVVLEANDNYYGEAPKLKRWIIRHVPEAGAQRLLQHVGRELVHREDDAEHGVRAGDAVHVLEAHGAGEPGTEHGHDRSRRVEPLDEVVHRLELSGPRELDCEPRAQVRVGLDDGDVVGRGAGRGVDGGEGLHRSYLLAAETVDGGSRTR